MGTLTRAQFLRRLVAAERRAEARITAVSRDSPSMWGRGMANEGYDGGYLAALRDVYAVLTHGLPSDDRGVWADDEK